MRDYAVISVIRAFDKITREEATPKRVRALIEGVGKLYLRQGILPAQGLGVVRSAATLQRLIVRARTTE
jgi:hypothetical protein